MGPILGSHQGEGKFKSHEVRDAPDDLKWEKKQEIHRQVTNTIKEIQWEVGEDLLEPEDLAVEYRTSSRKKTMKIEPQSRVGQIIQKILDLTQANIKIGQLLEIAPYCKRKIMEAIHTNRRYEREIPQTYLVATKNFDE